METGPLLLEGIWPSVLQGFLEHYILVPFLIASILLLVRSVRNRLIDLSGSLVAVRVHGVWDTTIEKDVKETSGENPDDETEGEPHETARLHGLVGFFRNQLIDLSGWLVAAKIHGKWDTPLEKDVKEKPSEETEEEPHETARLHQFFNKVWGKTEFKSDPNITFKVRGQIVGEKLSMIYRATEGFYSGAILLDIKSMKLMKGYEVGRHRKTGEIYRKTYTWHRREGRLS